MRIFMFITHTLSSAHLESGVLTEFCVARVPKNGQIPDDVR